MNSILLTVFNRDPKVIGQTLEALEKNDLSDCEVIVVDDGSMVDYASIKATFPFGRWVRIESTEYPSTTFMLPHEDGGVYNNPARAMNRAITEAKGERLIFLGSDCLLPPHAIAAAKAAGPFPWFGSVIDTCDGHEMVGAAHPRPYHWFLSVEKKIVDAVGGIDEEFLSGVGCEDDDFGAMLATYCGAIVFALDVVVEHQSHERWIDVAKDAAVGYERSLTYLEKKWGGSPPGPVYTLKRDENRLYAIAEPNKDCTRDPLNGARLPGVEIPTAGPTGFTVGLEPRRPQRASPERPHIFVGVPSIDGKMTVELQRYLQALTYAAATGSAPFTVSTAEVTGVAPVEYARNVLCGMAIDAKADLVVMIDADMKPDATVSRLFNSDADIIVPRMYRFRHHGKNGIHQGPPELTCCATIVEPNGERLDLTPELDAQGVYKVDFCGTGFIVIKRAVLDDPKMRVGKSEGSVPAIFRMTRNDVGRITTWEDVDFSKRATEQGYTVAVDFGARCGHNKTLDLDSIAELVYTRPERGEKRKTPEASIMDDGFAVEKVEA